MSCFAKVGYGYSKYLLQRHGGYDTIKIYRQLTFSHTAEKNESEAHHRNSTRKAFGCFIRREHMAIRLFGKHRNKTEKKAEMKYNEGMTFIANGYWDEAFAPICEAAKLGHRGATGQLAMMYFSVKAVNVIKTKECAF